MNTNDKKLEEFLLQSMKDSGELSYLSEEEMRTLINAIIESGALEEISGAGSIDLARDGLETAEEIAQRETDALLSRLGVGK